MRNPKYNAVIRLKNGYSVIRIPAPDYKLAKRIAADYCSKYGVAHESVEILGCMEELENLVTNLKSTLKLVSEYLSHPYVDKSFPEILNIRGLKKQVDKALSDAGV